MINAIFLVQINYRSITSRQPQAQAVGKESLSGHYT